MNTETKLRVFVSSILGFFASPLFFVPLAFCLMGLYAAPYPGIGLVCSMVAVLGSWFYISSKDVSFSSGLLAWDIISTVAVIFALLGTMRENQIPTQILWGNIVYIVAIFQVAIHLVIVLVLYTGIAPEDATEETDLEKGDG